MSEPVTMYMNENKDIFLRAHEAIGHNRNTTSLPIEEQIEGWKYDYHARIFGGQYEKDSNGNYSPHNLRDIGVEFETKEDYVLFMLEWS
jgi:hypothetical protein